MRLCVFLDVWRSVGLTVAAHIRCHRVVTGSGYYKAGKACRQRYRSFGQPCASTISGPSPCSAMRILIPFTWIGRCLMLFIWAELADIAANVAWTTWSRSCGAFHVLSWPLASTVVNSIF
jgi:hypothetical protein